MKISVIGLRGFPEIEGGVEKHCESLYPRLKNNIDITVYRRKPYVKHTPKYEHISFIDLPSTKIKGLEPIIHSLIATVDVLFKKPDAVHYHNIGPALFSPLLKMRRIPVILTFHSPNYEHNKWGPVAKSLLKFSEKVALNNAKKIVFVNSFQMQKYREEVQKKSVYIPNGINTLPIANKTTFLEKHHLVKGHYVLSVGRITPEKGFDTLVNAFNLADLQGYKLVIAGGVEFESNYMKKIKELSKNVDVVFTGYTSGDDLHQLYTHAALFVLASKNEGFPLVMLEAMSYGLDILVSDIPATHLVDLEQEDYFEEGNCQELANKMSIRLKDTKKRQYDLTKYDWNEISNEMSKIFLELITE